MSDQKSIFVIESNGFVAQKLAAAVAAHGHDQYVDIVESAPDAADSSVIKLSYPVRLGRVLDQIDRCLSEGGREHILYIGEAQLDVNLGLYCVGERSDPIRLTEKEVALLVILHKAQGEPISREDMLNDVWQYADGVETHTLETHIYRLRQKIEKDPANPDIIQINDRGYFLAFEQV